MLIIKFFLLGIVLGAVGIGLPTYRTLKVIDGDYLQVFVLSTFASICLMTFTTLVASHNMPFMIGNVVGSSISVTYIAYLQKKKLKKLEDEKLQVQDK